MHRLARAGKVAVNTLGLFELVYWLVVVQVLAFAVLPYVAWICPQAPDRGYGISKVIGVFCFASLTWLCSLAGLTSDNNFLVYACFAAFVLVGLRGYSSGWLSVSGLRELVRQYGWTVEGIFFGLTLLFGAIRFFNPEIFWGEKPMDSTFLNFFVRNQTLPPQDPWAAGSPMSYYYLGVYVIAALLKLTGIVPSIGYNLALATLAGWIGAALFTLCVTLTKNRKFSLWAVWIMLLASNPEVLRLSILNLFTGKPFNFDTTFWPSTRVFTSPSFLEYTSWSLLFADLHAHVIAIPFTVTALALAVILFLDSGSRYTGHGVVMRLLLGAVVGALFGLNTWDFITFGGVVGLFILCAQVPNFWKPPTNPDGSAVLGEVVLVTCFSRAVALIWDLVLFGSAAGLAVWLYRQGVSFRPAGGWGWVQSQEFNSAWKLFRVIGYYLVGMLVCVLTVGWVRRRDPETLAVPRVLVAAVLFALALIPGVLSRAQGFTLQPWGTFLYCGVLAAAAYLFVWRAKQGAEVKALGLLMMIAAFLIVVLEIFFLLDRMNTLFKGYMAVWMITGIATMVGAFYAYQALSSVGAARIKRVARGCAYVFLAMLIVGTAVNVFAVLRMQRVPKRTYTLDGTAYLRHSNPDDAAAANWLNRNVKGTPVMLEAQGDGYREFTRICMHTGIPVVFGWEHHARQRGLSHESALDRRKAIQAIYTHEDIEHVKQQLLNYKVDFIVVGAVERNTYRRLDPARFDGHPELFTKVFESGRTSIYVTYFSKYHPNYGSAQGGVMQSQDPDQGIVDSSGVH
jgi:YYY domain-containing protein